MLGGIGVRIEKNIFYLFSISEIQTPEWLEKGKFCIRQDKLNYTWGMGQHVVYCMFNCHKLIFLILSHRMLNWDICIVCQAWPL